MRTAFGWFVVALFLLAGGMYVWAVFVFGHWAILAPCFLIIGGVAVFGILQFCLFLFEAATKLYDLWSEK